MVLWFWWKKHAMSQSQSQCMMMIKTKHWMSHMICHHTNVEWMRQLRNVNQNGKLKTECRIRNGCQHESRHIVYIGAMIGITASVKHCRCKCICNLGISKFIRKTKIQYIIYFIQISVEGKFGISTNSRTIIAIILFHVTEKCRKIPILVHLVGFLMKKTNFVHVIFIMMVLCGRSTCCSRNQQNNNRKNESLLFLTAFDLFESHINR